MFCLGNLTKLARLVSLVSVICTYTIMSANAQTNTSPSSGDTGVGTTLPQTSSNPLGIQAQPYGQMQIRAALSGQNTYPWPSSGYVGIGTPDPTAPFDVSIEGSGELLHKHVGGQWIYGEGDYAPNYYLGTNARNLIIGPNDNYAIGLRTNNNIRMTISGNGNIGMGTQNPLFRLHAMNAGGFGLENADGTSQAGNVPMVAQSDNTALGILNSNSRQVFALNIDLNEGTTASRGVVNFYDKTNGTWHQDIALKSGSVGIGTTSPSAKLEVNGGLRFSADPSGTVQTTAWTGVLCGGDYAEEMNAAGGKASYSPGDVLVLTSDGSGQVQKSAEPYSRMVAGIYATKPGVIGRREAVSKLTENIPMAMLGVVPTKVNTANGPIRPGDLLVTSSTPGYAMKGTNQKRLVGAVIGKAMGNLERGTGTIEVLVTLQ